MKEKEKINSSRTTLLLKVSTELFELAKYENMLINSVSLTTIDSQYNYNNFEMNIENSLEIGNSITGISISSYNNTEKKKIKKTECEKKKKYSYKRPKFLYRLILNSSKIYNIINHINDLDLSKIRKRKIISEGKIKNIETPNTFNNILPSIISQEKSFLEKQGLKYLRDLSNNLKNVTKCRNNRGSMKFIKTMRLSVADGNVIKEKIKNINKNESSPKYNIKNKIKSDKNVIKVLRYTQYKNNNYKNINDLIFNEKENNKNNIRIKKNYNRIDNSKKKNNKLEYNTLKTSKKRSITFILPVNESKKNNHYIINQNVNKD